MTEELNLVKDLAIILISAGLFTIISKALKQPLILGYIVAGFIVGPHLGLFGISSAESVDQWSEIGIIFLLLTKKTQHLLSVWQQLGVRVVICFSDFLIVSK